MANVTSGIPQGSVVSPVLCVIYIYYLMIYLPDKIQHDINLFADDTKIYNKIGNDLHVDHCSLKEDLTSLQR